MSTLGLFREPIFLIYKITHRRSGRAYIGMTSRGLARRLREHRRAAERGVESPFYRAIRKYGWRAFKVTILAIATDSTGLLELEGRLIRSHRTLTSDGGFNIHIDTCSVVGRKATAETRERMRLAAIRRMAEPGARERISKSMKGKQNRLGKPCLAEHRAKISAAKGGMRRVRNG